MIKKILLLMVVAITLAGCGEKTSTNVSNNITDIILTEDDIPFIMEKLSDNSLSFFTFYRNTVTDVMYIYSGRGGIVEMSDPKNGLPLTYTRYKEIYESNYSSLSK